MIPLYQREAENFLGETEREYYENGAGLKDSFALSAIYEKYADLFTPDRVQELLAHRDEKKGRFLAHFAASQYLERSVCDLTDEITTAETQATIAWDGQHISYRRTCSVVIQEPDRERRRDLVRRLHRVTAAQNPLRITRLERLSAEAERLGFDSYCQLFDELSGLHLDRLTESVNNLLERTEDNWQSLFGTALDRHDIPRQDPHIIDLRWLLAGSQVDSLFPPERLVPVLIDTLHGLGIHLEETRNLHLDTEERELKSPRPFCCRVHVPSDVRLVISPRGGRDCQMMLLHEAGHALHGAYTNPSAPFEFRCLGDYTVTEALAFLLTFLVNSPAWLQDVAGLAADQDYLDFTRFHQLYFLRRLGARLGYEQELLARGPSETQADQYMARVGGALGVEMCRDNYLADVDDALYSASYLRAWMLEVQLRRKLITEFGESWFSQPAAGDFLRDLWWLGQELTAEELAQQLGYPGLQVEPLIEDVLAPLQG
ncbi:MAG: hypothetical protein JXB46_08940 [Candidatus Eisenbacteria bacterium]|nr:hypothetical protein [Candidatus Eisenbacteria bacterium]